jgi:hypothetical protein
LPMISPLWTRAVFNRSSGVVALTGWRFGKRPTFRMQDVTAVQLCGPISHADWDSYQLNLIFAPGLVKHDRLNLLDNGDHAALLRMGQELAEFLKVPFSDSTGQNEPDVKRSV